MHRTASNTNIGVCSWICWTHTSDIWHNDITILLQWTFWSHKHENAGGTCAPGTGLQWVSIMLKLSG